MRSVSSLPSGTFSQDALAGDLVDAVEFEVEKLADAQPACASQQQGVGGEPVQVDCVRARR